MARYSVNGQQTVVSTTPDTTVSITADATRPRRSKIYDFSVGFDGAPADNAFIQSVQRCTAAGTSTAVTPQPLDPSDAATETDAGSNHTVEPTYTANAILWKIAANQRATYRWVAAPGGELVIPATAANGLGWYSLHATATPEHLVTAHFEEQ